MKDFLSVRLASLYTNTGKISAMSQLFHDLRIVKPGYVEDPRVRLYFPAFGDTPLELDENDIEQLRKKKAEFRKYLKSVEQEMRKRYEEKERGKNGQHQRWQENTKPFSSGVLTFSELAKAVNIDELWNYGLKAIQTIAEKYKIKVLWVALHRDETTPHFHYMFENIDTEECKAFQSKLGRDGCSKLQDLCGKVMAPLGFRRGEKKKLSGAEHKNVMESHFIAREKVKAEIKELQEDKDSLQDKIGGSLDVLEGLLNKKERLIRELEALEVERKKLRRTKEEMLKETAEEKAATTALQQELRKKRTELRERLNEIIQLIETTEEDKAVKEALAMEVLKENAQEDEARIQEKINRYGLQDLYKFLQRVAHHGQLWVQAQGESFYTKKEYWDEPKLTTPNEVISAWKDLFEQNNLGTDWHLRILGTRPIFVLDDITQNGLEKLRRDGLTPFATLETSPGSFHAYIEMKLTGREILNKAEWNAVNSYLIKQYGGDKGANARGHAFRLPIGSSHKRAEPFELVLHVFEDAPVINADMLLREIAPLVDTAKAKMSRRHNISLDGSDAPDWFQEKWKGRREDLMKSGRAPKRNDGSVDESVVDFIVARDLLSAYKDKRTERVTPMLNFCYFMLKEEGESRGKAKPDDYSFRTVSAVIQELQLPVESHER